MEGGFGFPFGGDPGGSCGGLREFAEKQAETVHEARAVRHADPQHGGRADRCGSLADDPGGTAEEQAMALRDAMRVPSPEAVALVSAARQGFMREG